MPSRDDAPNVTAYLDEFESAARRFVAFVKSVTPPDDVRGGEDNVPGFEYAQRVAAATFRALMAHGEEINGAWLDVRRGRFGFDTALQTWAKLVDNYYGVFTEVIRGPSQLPRPAWLVIPYSKGKPPAPKCSVRVDGSLETGTALDYTKFESFGWDKRPVEGIYAKPPEVVVGSRVQFRLNEEVILGLSDNTDLVSFIFRKSIGSAPPLVIVLLRVTE